ncbi:phosphoenolpyruvate--protein phosphotransferase [Nocardia transvalensis]|uniref:phosphoenolpyruvate--protein phosphotransferase n=1 Tax=Nocardia transvalensis TaxID=37333 RepID=UPI001895A93C|nr:phosphoenolpyruvate--protein phosphotransferase [Nocardia transvalensis]MBF6327263.1 phosphoenolpyruvate--protein phosphotransferase [Nocardia transvalensis]
MIGIVVVSHSRSLARAAVDLAAEMLPDRSVRIETAAGLDEDTFGTDAAAVADAIAAADSGDGVLVLMDLGSAVLSAELALDLLDPSPRVRLCAAPLVEGLLAAAVSAAGGADLAEAATEAENALLAKQTQLGPTADADSVPVHDEQGGDSVSAVFVVSNRHGLHARPAARLIGALRGLEAQVWLRDVTGESGPVAGRSLSRVVGLGVRAGEEVEVTATGSDAQEAVDRVVALAARRFDEDDAADGDRSVEHRDRGPFPASVGIGIGPVWHAAAGTYELPGGPAGAPIEEWHRLEDALTAARDRLRARIGRAAGEAGIFEAHLYLLEDEELLGEVRRRIDEGAAAARAWHDVMGSAAAAWEQLSDEYQRARAADIRAVRDDVLAELLGQRLDIESRPGVLVAEDLTPAQMAGLDESVVAGIVLAAGSPTAHSSIIARAKGIPAVVGAGAQVTDIVEGTVLVLDGTTGQLVIGPDPATLSEFTTRAAEQRERRRAAEAVAHQPAVTPDGITVAVGANVGSVVDAADAMRGGADLAGLVRTEFLFLDRDRPPRVDEQEWMYRQIAEAFDGRHVVFRTLDVGGDKPLPYLTGPTEANPFLGLRGIRRALRNPELLRDQLRAIARVAADHPVGVMIPMVTAVDEVCAVREMLEQVVPQHISLDFGIMVEVPATALATSAFAPHVDFFSIGTNDLTQYALAAERGNASVADLADPLAPGLLRLIESVCRGADGRRVAVCGELAADPDAVPLLLGLGVTELSVAPPAVAQVKAAVRELRSDDCGARAAQALTCASAAEVRALAAARGGSANTR